MNKKIDKKSIDSEIMMATIEDGEPKGRGLYLGNSKS